MGNAGSDVAGGEKAVVREFVLKVPMSCRCDGCARKLCSAVKNLRLAPGVTAVDRSATETAEELRVLATADPERLRKRVSKAMDKKVHLVFPPPKPKPDLQRQAPPYYQDTGPPAHAWGWGAPTPYDAYPAPALAQPGHGYRPPTPNAPPWPAWLHHP